MANNKKQKNNKHRVSINIWEMVRHVLVASMNRGQFPLAMVLIVVMYLFWRMPEDDVSKLVFKIYDGLVDTSLLGWLLLFVALFFWYRHSKYQRSIWTQEMTRITKERNKYQEIVLNTKLGSSDR